MSITASELTPADIRACTGNGGDDGFGFGGNGAWWIIILFLFCFAGGWGNGNWGGGGASGAADNYVLASDFAQVERKLDTVNAGLCDGFYAMNTGMLNGFANTNTNILNTGYAVQNGINALGAQLAQCCCDNREAIAGVNYNMATNANMLSRDVERGFCDTQYRDAMNTNALMQAGHSDADRIIARLDAMEVARKDERIAEQNQKIFQLQLAASQEAQNNYLISQLGYQCPKPAYVVQPPQQVTFPQNSCGCGCGNF